jgi:WD40 repeat protein
MSARRTVAILLGVLTLLGFPDPCPAQPPENGKPARLDGDGRPLPAAALARLGTLRLRHRDPVSLVGFAGVGNKLLTASVDGTARLWDVARGQQLWQLPVPPQRRDGFAQIPPPPADLIHSLDGKTLAWGAGDQWLFVSAATGKEVNRLAREKVAADLKTDEPFDPAWQLSADGQLIVAAMGGKVGVWKTATGALVRVLDLGGKQRLSNPALSADGNTLAALEYAEEEAKATVRLWNLANGQQLRAFPAPNAGVTHPQFLPDGKTLVLHYPETGAVLLDAVTGKTTAELLTGGAVSAVLVSADGKRVALVGGKEVVLYDTATAKEVRKFPGGAGQEHAAAALSPDGKVLAMAAGVTVRLYDVGSGKELRPHAGHPDAIASLAFAPQGGQVLTGVPNAPVLLWDARSGKLLREFAFAPEEEEAPFAEQLDHFPWKTNGVQVAFAPDGRTVAGLVMGRSLQRWDAATAQPLKWADGATQLTAFAFAPNGKHVAVAGQGGVRLVDAATGKDAPVHRGAGRGRRGDRAGTAGRHRGVHAGRPATARRHGPRQHGRGRSGQHDQYRPRFRGRHRHAAVAPRNEDERRIDAVGAAGGNDVHGRAGHADSATGGVSGRQTPGHRERHERQAVGPGERQGGAAARRPRRDPDDGGVFAGRQVAAGRAARRQRPRLGRGHGDGVARSAGARRRGDGAGVFAGRQGAGDGLGGHDRAALGLGRPAAACGRGTGATGGDCRDGVGSAGGDGRRAGA